MLINYKGFLKMYTYQITFNDGKKSTSLNKCTSLKTLKQRYHNYLEAFGKGRTVNEVIVFKYRKIHSFRNEDFNIDINKPVDLHNLIFSL